VGSATALLVGPAAADQATTGSVDTGSFVIKSLSATNTSTSLTAVTRLDRLPSPGEAAFIFDTGTNDGSSMNSYHEWFIVLEKATGSRPTFRFARNSSVTGNDDFSCQGVELTWDRADARVGVVVPTRCFRDDRGMVRVGFQGPDEVSHGSYVMTRPLQLGARGARYGDLNGDGRVDPTRVTTDAGRYRLSADLGRRTVAVTGPMSSGTARIVSRLDIDKDGRSEVVVNVGEIGGGFRYHLFTLVRGELRPVTTGSGRLVARTHMGVAGPQTYPDVGFRCAGRTLQTWTRTSGTNPLELRVRTWTLDGARATGSVRRSVSVDRSVATLGNWSRGSCLTR
jgi:hypothetical protein